MEDNSESGAQPSKPVDVATSGPTYSSKLSARRNSRSGTRKAYAKKIAKRRTMKKRKK